ncbi:MAG: C25 family cysteine peptidase, partial [bacterium]
MISFLLMTMITISDIPVTRWVGPGSPTSYQQWVQNHNTGEKVVIENIYNSPSDLYFENGLITLMVENDLYSQIIPSLNLTISDIEQIGYQVNLFTVNSVQGIPACDSIRNTLASYIDSGLVGVYFIGEVPISWFQMIDKFSGTPEDFEEFPCDLYFMDLDGIWTDDSSYVSGNSMTPGPDGVLDGHQGNIDPEIWCGRLYFSTLGDEEKLTNNYLRRTHMYRNDSLSSVHRGLTYVDDDWAYWSSSYAASMNQAYSEVVRISQVDTTNPANYRNHLVDNYEFVGLFCHSSPYLHSFKIEQGNSWSDLYATELPEIYPPGLFYNMFACSNVRYIESGYMGGMYVMGTPTGLNCIGSTKTGSMLDFTPYYYPLGQGNSFGQAFYLWFDHIAQNGFTNSEQSWHYGMTYIGDPTLHLRTPCCYLEVCDYEIMDTAGNNDHRMDPGESVDLYFYLKNHPQAEDALTVSAELISLDSSLTVVSSNQSYGTILAGDSSVNASPFTVTVANNAEIHLADMVVFCTDQNNHVFSDTFSFMVGREPLLIIDDDDHGNSELSIISSLDNLNTGYEIIDRDSLNNLDAGLLNPYQAVLWTVGLDDDGTLTTSDQTAIDDYLQQGGNLFICGNHLAEELQGTSFLNATMGVSFLGKTTNHYQQGIPGDPISDNLQIVTTSLGQKDVISVYSTALPCFYYQQHSDSISMIRNETWGKLVYSSYSFHGISSTVPGFAKRDTVMSRILNYFNVQTPVEEITMEYPLPLRVNLECTSSFGQNFILEVECPLNQHLNISIFDICGRRINVIYSGVPSISPLNIYWRGTDSQGRQLHPGTFFIVATAEGNRMV